MVDPVDLALAQRLQEVGVQRPGGSKVVAERLLDHDPAPLTSFLVGEARGAETGDGDTEESIGDREIEQIIAGGARCLVQPGEMVAQPPIGPRIVQIALEVGHPVGQPAPRSPVAPVGV